MTPWIKIMEPCPVRAQQQRIFHWVLNGRDNSFNLKAIVPSVVASCTMRVAVRLRPESSEQFAGRQDSEIEAI